MANRLLLARHAETALTRDGRFIGVTDLPLSAAGREQARALARIVAAHAPARVLASPLRRCRETVELATGNTCLPVEYLADLREIDFGAWEGLTFAEIVARDPELVNQWAVWAADFSFPGGEGLGQFQARIETVAANLRARPEETLLVVAHGGVIRALLCHLLHLAPRNYLLFEIKPARLSVVELYNEGGVLAALNLE